MHIIQWKRTCYSDYIWIILIDEFNKLHISTDNFVLLFIILYWLDVHIFYVVCCKI